jgi:TRAP-type mannitol/chloroaromatic compound transport system permease small subunit
MQRLLALARRIDRLNERIGAVASWLTLLMVAAGAYNAIARHVDRAAGVRLSSNAWIEAQWYMFSLVFLLGAAYTLKRDEHVRVDVLHGRLSAKGKAWIDVVGTVVLMVPFCVLGLWVAVPSVIASFKVREGSPDPGGLPRYPLKAVVLIAFALLLLQAFAILIKKVAELRGLEIPKDPSNDEGAT